MLKYQIGILSFIYIMLSFIFLGSVLEEPSSFDSGISPYLVLIPISTIILCIGSIIYVFIPNEKPKHFIVKTLHLLHASCAILYGIGFSLLGIYLSLLMAPSIGLIPLIPAIGSLYLGIVIIRSLAKENAIRNVS